MGRGLDVFFLPRWPACSFQASPDGEAGRRAGNGMRRAFAGPTVFGGNSEGDTPLPIPNRAVKPLSADGTWWETAWESRSPPVLTETIRAASAPLGRLFSLSDASSRAGRRSAGSGAGRPGYADRGAA